MLYDRQKFAAAVRPHFPNGKMTVKQWDGVDRILSYAEQRDDDLKWLAYRLATTFHETAHTMQPIEEYGRGKGKAYGPTGFWGRGLVQLTWEANYAKAGKKLGVDFVSNPALVMQWDYALPIMFEGMDAGWFTGKKLSDYFSRGPGKADPVNARRIINGTDKAGEIAGIYAWFVAALLASEIKDAAPSHPDTCPTCGQPWPHAA